MVSFNEMEIPILALQPDFLIFEMIIIHLIFRINNVHFVSFDRLFRQLDKARSSGFFINIRLNYENISKSGKQDWLQGLKLMFPIDARKIIFHIELPVKHESLKNACICKKFFKTCVYL